MTDIKIKRLALENFKCHKSLTLNFEGGNASIYGDNATGKTSIYDGLDLRLFGKGGAGLHYRQLRRCRSCGGQRHGEEGSAQCRKRLQDP